ncbi:twin-arginine translocase subunit TatC [Granulicella tundricola]|uniref:Sec-independent protein translocase protein TatC n=1 Tax=Granulicella tundricola (strain ATCC BAA-1859 / DSM 23138 / MP5ACTX9) TaxID=1198114 RepID=E8X125_GRATM|nr:twin-arginine translocase subunit TatC [Granulicella tundricola]ADW67891.1 Sec-independent protein translocase, TatC subunit [Granulicella tundricola MP5ACTX9]
MADLIDNVRANVADRADLPGMTLMEHLDELRKRLIRAVIALLCGFGVAYIFHVRLFGYIQKPLNDLGMKLAFTHPTDPLNLYIKTALVGGAIIASPFILYQLWLFISPGMYANEKRYVWPFMGSTVGLFLAGAWFGYRYILPGALSTLINGFGKGFQPIITIEDYTGFFLAIILGLGITFELPILIFFLSLFGIVDAKFLLKHIRYAVLIIFLITAIICPLPDPISMCIFASPMLVLYGLGVVIAVFVNPNRRKAKELKAS